MRLRLAIVSTHPIQYYSPVFRALAESPGLDVRVFYTWSQAERSEIFDPGFGAALKWDIPLLDGYGHQFVRNVAGRPGLHHFLGLRTPSLAQEIEAWRADAVLVYTWNSLSHLQILRHFKGRLPVFFRGDSNLLDPRSWWRARWRRACLTWIYRHVDVAIAVGSNNRDYFEWCGMPPARIALAPHSVDTARFGAEATIHDDRAARWRAELGIGADALVFLFAGKLQSKKNPRLLLEAFPALQGDCHLVFVGNGDLERDLQERARNLSRVHFLPFQNQRTMPAVYRLGDVFVLPSQGPEETWGLALNEAMASGRPVIASTLVGGARDLIVEGVNGWAFRSGDQNDLEAVLGRALKAGKMALRVMGATAQRQSAAFSTEEVARRIAEIVLSRVAGHDGRKNP